MPSDARGMTCGNGPAVVGGRTKGAGKFSGVGAKVFLLAVVPVLTIAGLSAQIALNNISYTKTAVESRNVEERESARLNRNALAVQEQMLELTQAISKVVRRHQENLLLPSRGASGDVLAGRRVARQCIKDFNDTVQNLAALISDFEPLDIGADGTELAQELEQRMSYLARWSNNLPRLFKLFEQANDRTTTALQSGDSASAMANYIYEETSHLAVLDNRVNKMSAVLGDMVESLSTLQGFEREASAARILEEIASSNLRILTLIATTTFILLGVAVAYSHFGLTKPLVRLIASMKELGNGNKKIEIPTGAGEIGEMAHTLAVFRDNAVAKEAAEEQLIQAQKMESIGQLTGGVAHDFNNLLCVVLGNLELLQEKLEHDEHLRKLVQRAIGAADKGAVLVQRLLAFSRKQTLMPKETDIGDMVEGMSGLLRRTLGEWVEIRTETEDEPCIARIDSAQLENVLLNLALNARDAMSSRGTLTIAARNTYLDDTRLTDHEGLEPGHFVLVSATDTGEGIPAEHLERVFEPFFTTKEVGKGSGLGLSMIYGFVKQSGGHIEIESHVGTGTSIRIYLPRVL
ncbi:MAG: ATP-binding protein [Sphingomonadales bacterium]